MADIPRPSFIPKQSGSAIPATMRRRKTFSVFNFLTSIALVASLAAAGGAYFYKGITQKNLDATKLELAEEEKKGGVDKLNEVRDFNRQLLAVRFLLDRHIAPSKIFDALERTTMERIQLLDFSLEYDPQIAEILVSSRGGTEEFKTIALQSTEFEGRELLKTIFFSALNSENVSSDDIEPKTKDEEDTSHSVSFTVTGKVPLDLLMYEGGIEDSVPEGNQGNPG